MKHSIYPAVIRSQRTLLNDDDLIDAVRSGCGDDVAAVLKERLAEMNQPSAYRLIKDALGEIRSAIMSASNAEDDLEDAIERMDKS